MMTLSDLQDHSPAAVMFRTAV